MATAMTEIARPPELPTEPAWQFGSLRRGAYRAILADPPWKFRLYSSKGENKSPQSHYACLSEADLRALPVGELAHPDGCALVLWATAPMLPRAVALMAAWGFAYKSAGAWAKRSSTGQKWAFGTGYVYRSAAEFWLLGTRGRVPTQSRSIRNLIIAPAREHSRKPDQMRADIEALWPGGPYAELFARESDNIPGWDLWGAEVGKFHAEQPRSLVA